MGMYSALIPVIKKRLEELQQSGRTVVEITRTGKVVSQPFSLFQKKQG